MLTQISRKERLELARLETVIKAGLRNFAEVGESLAKISESRLYRETHDTFPDYCQEKWGISKSRAYQLIDAWKVSTIVDVENEGQARVLAGHAPEVQQAAFQQAIESGQTPTAAVLEELLDQIEAEEGDDEQPVRVKRGASTADLDARCRRYALILRKLSARLDTAESGMTSGQIKWLEVNPFS